MYLVPKPDRLDRAMARVPIFRPFVALVVLEHSIEHGHFLFAGIFVALLLVGFIYEFVPPTPGKKESIE